MFFGVELISFWKNEGKNIELWYFCRRLFPLFGFDLDNFGILILRQLKKKTIINSFLITLVKNRNQKPENFISQN